jgi:hypothetical protein
MTETAAQMVAAVKAHALASYEKNGWDFIVECWDDAEIAERIAGCRTSAGAIRRVRQTASLLGEQRDNCRDW